MEAFVREAACHAADEEVFAVDTWLVATSEDPYKAIAEVSLAEGVAVQKMVNTVEPLTCSHRRPIEVVSALEDLADAGHNQEVVPYVHFVDIELS